MIDFILKFIPPPYNLYLNKTTITFGLAGIIILGVWSYHKYNVYKIEKLTHNIEVLVVNNGILKKNIGVQEKLIHDQKEAIDSTMTDMASIKTANKHLAKSLETMRISLNELDEKFHKTKTTEITTSSGERVRVETKRNVGKIASRKPDLFASVINKATERQLRCMEIASGATPGRGDEGCLSLNGIDSGEGREK